MGEGPFLLFGRGLTEGTGVGGDLAGWSSRGGAAVEAERRGGGGGCLTDRVSATRDSL